MAGGLRYETGRDMPPGMQALVAGNWVKEVQRILEETYQQDDRGIRYFLTKWVPLPDAAVIAELNGTGLVVVDRKGGMWMNGKPWEPPMEVNYGND